MRRHPWWVHAAIVAVVAGVALWLTRSTETGLPTLFPAPSFTLVDQEGNRFSSRELEGEVWVVSFVYTTCPDVCPLITARMAALRDSLESDGLMGDEVRLVSITVDPEHDRPDVLRDYAAGLGAPSPSEWAFLTGSPDTVRRVVVEGFHVAADPLASTPGADPHARHDPAPAAAAVGDSAEPPARPPDALPADTPRTRDVVPDSVPDRIREGLRRELGDTAPQAGADVPAAPGADTGPAGRPSAPDTTVPTETRMIAHGEYVLLVDRRGIVRAVHSGTNAAEMAELLAQIRRLVR